jgi:hypothetical protein
MKPATWLATAVLMAGAPAFMLPIAALLPQAEAELLAQFLAKRVLVEHEAHVEGTVELTFDRVNGFVSEVQGLERLAIDVRTANQCSMPLTVLLDIIDLLIGISESG